MTTSSRSARRRYFERSSLTSARATARRGRAFCVEPRSRPGLGDHAHDFDGRFCNVIEHPDVADPRAELRLARPPQPCDPASADLRRFMPELHLNGVPDFTPNERRKRPQRPSRGEAPAGVRRGFLAAKQSAVDQSDQRSPASSDAAANFSRIRQENDGSSARSPNPCRTSFADGVERPYPGWSPDSRRVVFAATAPYTYGVSIRTP